jgi:hypothetical protein
VTGKDTIAVVSRGWVLVGNKCELTSSFTLVYRVPKPSLVSPFRRGPLHLQLNHVETDVRGLPRLLMQLASLRRATIISTSNKLELVCI